MAKTDAADSQPARNSSSNVVIFSESPSSIPDDVGKLLQETHQLAASFHANQAQSPPSTDDIRIQSAPAELAPIIADLNRCEIQVHKYQNKSAAEAGFLGFGGVEAQLLEAGLVHEAKRFLVKKTEKKRHVEFGIAVRLWIAVTKFNLEVELTVPNLAASAQLTNSNATIGLSVSGFSGALGNLLPSPQSLNVENFSVYLDAFSNIQAHVFGAEAEDRLSPVLLGFHKLDGDQDTSS